MILKYKIYIASAIVLSFAVLSLIIYKQSEIINRQKSIEAKVIDQKDLIDGIVRSKSQYATSDDIEKFIKDNDVNLSAIKKDISTLDSKITDVNVVVTKSSGQKGSGGASTGNGSSNPEPSAPTKCKDGTDCPSPDKYGYLKLEKKFNLNEKFGDKLVPIGSVGFSAWQENPWSYDLKSREYRLTNVISTDENQRHIFHNTFTIKVDDKIYQVPILTGEAKQEFPEAKLSWWNPRIFMGLDYGLELSHLNGSVIGSLDLQLLSYGMYLNQPDFSILGLGIGYDSGDKNINYIVTPITYNIGKRIPLMNNFYLGPSIQFDNSNNVVIALGIRSAL